MLKRFNAFTYGEKTELPKLNEASEPIKEPEIPEIHKVKEELCEKYLYSTENNGVIGITVESDEQGEFIQFNIECETELQSVSEYKGYRLGFNRLCEVPYVEKNIQPEEDEEINIVNEDFVNFIKNKQI